MESPTYLVQEKKKRCLYVCVYVYVLQLLNLGKR